MPAEERAPIIEVRDLRKDYRALRPLRIGHLSLAARDRAALVGLDGPAAEVLVNLITAASTPDAGDVRIFGRATTSIGTSEEWLSYVDRFGIVSDRVVLLDELTVAQNLAVPLTLDIDPVPSAVLEDVARIAREVGVAADAFDTKVGATTALDRARIRLGRAVALDPEILLLEHATATLEPGGAALFGSDVLRTVTARGLTLLALTADERFADACGARVYRWQPATGALTPRAGWTRWFR